MPSALSTLALKGEVLRATLIKASLVNARPTPIPCSRWFVPCAPNSRCKSFRPQH